MPYNLRLNYHPPLLAVQQNLPPQSQALHVGQMWLWGENGLRVSVQQELKMSEQPLGEVELPSCEICHLQPTPESTQYLLLIALEVLLIFYSFKLAIALFFLGYCFARNIWLCPQCRREVEVTQEVQGSAENLVLRFGNCMIMLSRGKFRAVAGVVVAAMGYLFVVELQQRPKYVLEKTWRSLATNCGYEAMLENPFKANTMYAEYPQLGEWQIEGIFLREQASPQQGITRMYLKMNPSQFKHPSTEDIIVIQTSHTLRQTARFQLGDLLKLKGQWQGREGENHLLRFLATSIEAREVRVDLTQVELLSAAEKFISAHEEEKRQGLRINREEIRVERIAG